MCFCLKLCWRTIKIHKIFKELRVYACVGVHYSKQIIFRNQMKLPSELVPLEVCFNRRGYPNAPNWQCRRVHCSTHQDVHFVLCIKAPVTRQHWTSRCCCPGSRPSPTPHQASTWHISDLEVNPLGEMSVPPCWERFGDESVCRRPLTSTCSCF